MKSLVKVIKNKIRLIDVQKPESNEPGSNSISEVFTQHLNNGKKPIYLVKNLNNKNIIELLQQITPLFYYSISRLKNEEENLLKEIVINLEFPPSKKALSFLEGFKINDENPLNSFKKFIKKFKTEGYFITFTKHFNLLILPKNKISETFKNSESEILNFFLPDCVKRGMEEIAGEAMGKKLMEFKKKMINLEKNC